MLWTFVEIPEIMNPNTAFGMFRVSGSIDGYVFTDKTLLPTGNGIIGLPISAKVRKLIGNKAPDTVHVILYEYTPLIITENLLLCMADAVRVTDKFYA